MSYLHSHRNLAHNSSACHSCGRVGVLPNDISHTYLSSMDMQISSDAMLSDVPYASDVESEISSAISGYSDGNCIVLREREDDHADAYSHVVSAGKEESQSASSSKPKPKEPPVTRDKYSEAPKPGRHT